MAAVGVKSLATALVLLALTAGPLAARCQEPTALGSGAARRVELLNVRFDPTLTSAAAAGAVALDFRLARQHANLSFGADVARLAAGAWVEVPPEELVIEAQRLTVPGQRESFGARMVILAIGGWEHGASYRVRFSAALPGDPEDLALDDTFTWQVKPKAAAAVLAPIVFEKRYPVGFDSAKAAADTLGGRFPGGQPLLFQGAWTDPVTGLAYHRGRWYDPRNGVYLSEDPMRDAESTNLYAFVGWRPAERTDPTGLLGGSDYADEAFLRAMREKTACGANCDVATNLGRGLDAVGDAAIDRGSMTSATTAYALGDLTPANDAAAVGEVLLGGELARGVGAGVRWLARTPAAQRFFASRAGRLLTTDVRTLARRLNPFDFTTSPPRSTTRSSPERGRLWMGGGRVVSRMSEGKERSFRRMTSLAFRGSGQSIHRAYALARTASQLNSREAQAE